MLKKVLILLLLPFLLSACIKKNYEEISFSSWGSATEVGIIKELISSFEAENPDIRVNFIHIPQNYFQKLHLLFASSQTPDVIFINNLYLPLYKDFLLPLDEETDKNAFFPQSIEALSADGVLYAVPRDISNLVFYYNKNRVKKDIPSDWNLQDFENIIKNIKQPSVSFERDTYFLMPYIVTFGGGITEDKLQSPETKKALDFCRYIEKNYAPSPSQVGSSTQAQMFLEQKIAFYLSGRWMYPKISEKADFDVGIVTFPGTVPADASGWAVSKNSKHREASIRFVKFLSSEKNIRYMCMEKLIVPARIDVSRSLDNDKERVFLNAIRKSAPDKTDKRRNKTVDKINRELFG